MSLESPTGQVGQTHSLGMLDSILCVDITLLDVSFLIFTRVGITCLASQGGGGGGNNQACGNKKVKIIFIWSVKLLLGQREIIT